MHVLVRFGSRGGRVVCVAAALGLAALLVAGCGATSASSAAGSSSSSGFSAYLSCLRQHGVKVPTSRPSGAPGGGGGFGGGGFGGGFGGSSGSSSAFQKASKACASLRPSGGGFRGGFGGFASALASFRSCMKSHGEPIPTARPTSPPTGGSSGADRFLNGLNPSNSKVAAALKACESKLPSFAGGSG
jgi:hypothetical protein